MQRAFREEPGQAVHVSDATTVFRGTTTTPNTPSKHSPDSGTLSKVSTEKGIRGIPDPSERLPNLQIHGRGLSGFPPFGGEGHSRLRGNSARARARAPDANRSAGRRAERHNPQLWWSNVTNMTLMRFTNAAGLRTLVLQGAHVVELRRAYNPWAFAVVRHTLHTKFAGYTSMRNKP